MKTVKNVNKVTIEDVSTSIAKGVVGSIPIIGSLAAELFGQVITPPLEKRRAEWMNDVAEKLNELEENQIIDFNNLRNNELFIDIVLQATSFVIKTSEKLKIESYRNAILNTAKGNSPDETKSQIFLNQLDKFTTWHIVVLDFINSPRRWYERMGKPIPTYSFSGSLHGLITDTFPELKNQDDLLDIIWDDLKTTGFHRTGGLKTMMTGDGVLSDRGTPLGKEFIKFISSDT